MKGNTIVEVIYNNNGGVYFAGQNVDGYVRLQVPDSQQIKEINLRWLGHATVSWSEGTGDDSTSYSDKETYFDTKMALLEKEPYRHGYSKLLQDVYRYPFSFQLPLDIPNSYQGFSGWVRYEVTVTVVGPCAFDISKSFPFTVISHLDLNTFPSANTKGVAEDEKVLDCLCCMSGFITATITTDRLGYVPGEAITFTAEIHNKSDTDMHPCKAALSVKVRYHAIGCNNEETVILSKLRGPAIRRGRSCIWERQKLYIPPSPPSFLHGCKLIDIEYFVSITVDPVGPSFALLVPLMIVIGTIPLKTTTHIIPQLEFAQSQLLKNDLSPLYPSYTFKSRRNVEFQLAKRRTRILKRAF
uniref:Beta-arrestin 2 n=1 Tax=Sinohyriopsis cumingii TaxID=165450 RepID=A0A1Y0JZ25_SINCU|nr:beta-arrestin 2 [Sinohyriopsis cumingii]